MSSTSSYRNRRRAGLVALVLAGSLLQACAGNIVPSRQDLSVGVTNAAQLEVAEIQASFTDDEIRKMLRIDSARVLNRSTVLPSSGFLTPSAYGADNRDAYIGIAGVSSGNSTDVDGSSSLGVGFGSAVDSVGVELNAAIISLRESFAEDGSIGVKVHKTFRNAGNLAVAVGWSNVVKWGAAENAEDTFYGVATRQFELRPAAVNTLPLTASVGLGTGTFRSESAIRDDENTPNLFASLGVRIVPAVQLISNWTGSSLGLAASAVPFRFPLVLTAGISDVTDRTTPGPRFQGSLGYSINF